MGNVLSFFLQRINFSARIVPPFLQYKEGQRYFFTTDGNGELQFVDLKETEINSRFEAEQDVVFRLFTRYFHYYNLNNKNENKILI